MNVINSAFSFVRQMTPDIVSTAIHSDPRIRNIAEGILFAGSGVGLILGSCWRYANAREDAREGTANFPFRKQVTYWGVGGIGALFVVYGTLQALSEVIDFTTPFNFFSPTCENRVKAAREALDNCPHTKNLWGEAEEAGPISIECNRNADAKGELTWNFNTRTVFVHPHTFNIPPKLVQALSSLQNPQSVLYLAENACKFSPEQFGQAMEMNDYLAAVKTNALTTRCIQEKHWSELWEFYRNRFERPQGIEDWSTLQKFLIAQRVTGHTLGYEKMWARTCGSKETNPKAKPVLKEYL